MRKEKFILTFQRMKFYAVAVGRCPGIYTSWSDAETQVRGYPGAKYKSFASKIDAELYLDIGPVSNCPALDAKEINNVRVYTDGSCIDAIGGYGIVWIQGNKEISYKGRVPVLKCTNNIAELYAIDRALDLILISSYIEQIDLYTDSMYCINALTVWSKKWINNGWISSTGEPVKNRELIEQILDKLDAISNLKLLHVKGHAGNRYNELVDKLANEGRLMM